MIKIVLVLSLMELAAPTSIPIHKQVVGPGGENIDIDIQVDIDTGDDESDAPAPEPTKPDFGRHSTPSAPPIITSHENKCMEEGEVNCGPNSCCDGLECVTPPATFLPGRCKKPLPKCLAKGQFDCRPLPPAALLHPNAKECCPGLRCSYNPCKADFPWCQRNSCEESVEPKSTTPPSKCLAEGKYDCSSTNPEEKCCDGLECSYNLCKAGFERFWQRFCFICVKKSLEAAKCLKTGQDCTPGNPEAKCCPNNLCDLDNRKCVRVAFRRNL